MNQKLYNQLCTYLKPEDIKVNEPLSNHTTFHIGGPADFFVSPSSTVQIKAIIDSCKTFQTQYYVIGNGSNLLVGDLGFRGVIIMIAKKMSDIWIEDGCVTAQAGVNLSKLAVEIANHRLTGFEFAAGIPGTLGGAITMNAGAYGGEIKQAIVSATVLDREGNVFTINRDELELDYRSSVIQKQAYIVLEATFSFLEGEKKEILEKIVILNTQRKEKQPLEYPSVGSTFKRPAGCYAGKLIMDAGLRGYRVGDIMISEKHCGFVINVGEGTAKQVRTLIENVDQIVYDKFGIHLEPEVRMIGEF